MSDWVTVAVALLLMVLPLLFVQVWILYAGVNDKVVLLPTHKVLFWVMLTCGRALITTSKLWFWVQ